MHKREMRWMPAVSSTDVVTTATVVQAETVTLAT
jgi:hypothetical protein